MPAVPHQSQQFDFYKYLRILWRRKWFLLIPLSISLPVAILGAVYYPTEYESKAVLELTNNRPLGDTTGGIGSVGFVLSTVNARMLSWNSVRDVVLSRKVDFGREVDPDDRRQIERLYYEICRATRLKAMGARHMAVTHKSTSPEKNAALINELVKEYVGEDRRDAQEKAKIDLKYYNEKLAVAKAHLGEIETRIREANQANPWLATDLSSLNRDYEDAQQREMAIRREITEIQAQVETLKKDLMKEEPEITVVTQKPVSQDILAARKYAADMEAYFKGVNDRYTPAHRMWREAKARYDEAMARLKEVDKGGEDKVEDRQPNPKYAELQAQIETLNKRVTRLEELRLLENKKVSELYVKVRRAPELLANRTALEEERRAAQETVDDYAKGARAADKELQRLMTEAYSSNFRVLEYARDDHNPVHSTQAKIIALGVLLGLLAGAALIALMEYLDQSFKTIDEARDLLGIPALGVIPAIFTPRDHRRRLWFRVLSVSSAVFVVGVGVAIYLMVPATQQYLSQAWMWFQEQMQRW